MTRARVWLVGSVLFTVLVLTASFAIAKSASFGLDGSGWAGSAAESSVRPGQDDSMTVSLQNRSGHTVFLESASLIKFAYFQAPELRNLAVEGGGFSFGNRGWPPVSGTMPFRGFKVRNDTTVDIAYGVVSDRTGNFGSAGITHKVKTRSGTAQVRAFGALGACVTDAKKLTGCSASFARNIQYASQPSSRRHPHDGALTGGAIFKGKRPPGASGHKFQAGTIELMYHGRILRTAHLDVAGLQYYFAGLKAGQRYTVDYFNTALHAHCTATVTAKPDHEVDKNVYCRYRG